MTPSVVEFDAIMNGPFAKYMTLSGELGGDVESQAKLVKTCFTSLRELILTAASNQAPDEPTFKKMMGPCSCAITAVIEFKDKNRSSKQFNQISSIAESIPALGWVTVKPAPAPYVKEMSDAGQFYSNRVLKDFKDKDQKQVEWCKAWTNVWTEMQSYVKQFHTTGLTWNPQGAKAPAGVCAPPPPPPPPPAADFNGSHESDTAARAELFQALNRGSEVTAGLKKVTDDMKTHKNPNLRASNVVPDGPVKKAGTVFKGSQEVKKPPCKELRGNKWCLEYIDGDHSVEVISEEIKQSVYIYRCTNCTIQIKGKVNSIVLDSCKKVGLVFESVIACLDLVNCQSVQAQVKEHLPAVNIDKTDGAQVFLSEASKAAEIVTAKSSSVNVTVPTKDGDFAEHPIPEQFKSRFDGTKMVTTVSDSI